jgi:UDP:flavonoid glycosyltransferase YjiC (YdhE family)
VLLVGQDPRNRPAGRLPDTIFTAEYADYARLFPRARAIVHQGGIGTTAQALRSGRPMLVMPFGFDQFDNAARVARLGVARLLNRHKYSANIAARELNNLLNDPVYAQNAKAVGEQVNGENGLSLACQAVEGQLALLKR